MSDKAHLEGELQATKSHMATEVQAFKDKLEESQKYAEQLLQDKKSIEVTRHQEHQTNAEAYSKIQALTEEKCQVQMCLSNTERELNDAKQEVSNVNRDKEVANHELRD